jgi:hypothetical protein
MGSSRSTNIAAGIAFSLAADCRHEVYIAHGPLGLFAAKYFSRVFLFLVLLPLVEKLKEGSLLLVHTLVPCDVESSVERHGGL